MCVKGTIPMAEQCKAQGCSRSIPGIAGSNNVGGMVVCLLWVLHLLAGRGLCNELITRPEESYRLWCVIVWSRNIKNKNAMARVGTHRHGKKKSVLMSVSRKYLWETKLMKCNILCLAECRMF